MKTKFLGVVLIALLTDGCSSAYPPIDKSTITNIDKALTEASNMPRDRAAVPDAVKSSLLPPLKNTRLRGAGNRPEQRFDLIVSNEKIDQVLLGLVHDTPYSFMLKPKTEVLPAPATISATANGAAQTQPAAQDASDRVTVNLKNVTIFEALDSIREVYGYDYTVEGNRIYVQPPELQTRLYQVNYVIGQRRGVSDLQVIAGASVGASAGSGSSGSSGSGSSSGSGGSFSSVQASGLSSMSKSDIWAEVEDTLRTTLGCQIPHAMPGQSTSDGGSGGSNSGSSSRGGGNQASRADVKFQGDTGEGERLRGVEGCTSGRALNVNQMSGTILVKAMPQEHRMIGKFLRSMQMNIERQVIIEAKIIDVELNKTAQQGVNWAAFQKGIPRMTVGADTSTYGAVPVKGATLSRSVTTEPAGTTASTSETLTTAATAGTSLGGLLAGGGPAGAIAAGLGLAFQFQSFSALINFLETQGQVHVLSSPRVATLNNQKAVLKVGREEPYVTNATGGQITAGTGGSPSTVSNPSITYQPFFSGISLDVTPQVDEKGDITLQVHTLVNKVSAEKKLAIVGSTGSTSDRYLDFAVNNIKETDSVIKTRDGQMVVIGGLIDETVQDDRNKVPGVGDAPAVGAMFRKGAQQSQKRELVILLKPTVVHDERAWNEDISRTQERIDQLGNDVPVAQRAN